MKGLDKTHKPFIIKDLPAVNKVKLTSIHQIKVH